MHIWIVNNITFNFLHPYPEFIEIYIRLSFFSLFSIMLFPFGWAWNIVHAIRWIHGYSWRGHWIGKLKMNVKITPLFNWWHQNAREMALVFGMCIVEIQMCVLAQIKWDWNRTCLNSHDLDTVDHKLLFISVIRDVSQPIQPRPPLENNTNYECKL